MKVNVRKRLIKATAIGALSLSLIGGVSVPGLMAPAIIAEAATIAPADATEVKTIEEFEKALLNSQVKDISVKGSFSFRKDITKVPARNVTIYGNKEEGHVINSKHFAINGQQGTEKATNEGKNKLFSIVDAKITAAQIAGRFFTGGSGNGPSSFGWDVYAKDVDYDGDRFVHLSEGKLTFDGTNTISTRAENAWVHQLEFLPGSVYNGKAAQMDHGQFSAFYFNGRLVNGFATGKVNVGDKAQVNIAISTKNDINFYYPAFYDKVYQVNVGKEANLAIDAAGVGFQFIPRADYLNIPSLNLAQSSKMTVNGRGGGNYATVKIQEYGTQVNMDKGSELIIDGNSSKGVIESIYEFASFNLDNPENLEITNHMANQNIFYADRNFIRGAEVDEILTWGQRGGTYPAQADRTFNADGQFSMYVGLLGDATNNNKNGQIFSPNPELVKDFQLGNYGKVSFKGGKGTVTPPEPVWYDYTLSAVRNNLTVTFGGADTLEFYINDQLYTTETVSYSKENETRSFTIQGLRPTHKIEVRGYHNGVQTGEGKLN